jgi:RNA polymerase sigma-70 factor (ECF subfamily)
MMLDTPVSLLDRLCDKQDAASWRRWFDLYTPLIRQWLARYALQPHDADEVVQEVLVVVVRELPQFRHNQHRGAFRAWLRGVLANRLRRLWDSRKLPQGPAGEEGMAALAQLEDPDSSLSHLWDQEHDHYVARRLMELVEPEFAPATWKAFQLLALEGKPPDEVAAELGISTNAVRIAKSRVLSRLRQESAGLID